MKPSPVPAALLALLVLAWIPLTALWPLLPRSASLYRVLDLADRATLLASAIFLAVEAVRGEGRARVVAGATAVLAGVLPPARTLRDRLRASPFGSMVAFVVALVLFPRVVAPLVFSLLSILLGLLYDFAP